MNRTPARSPAKRQLISAFQESQASARVRAAGAPILKPIFSFPGGRRFHFADPAGNELAVWGE